MADEEPSLRRTERGSTAVWKGIDLYPSPDPMEYARRKARVFSLAPRTLVFVPSVGLGHGLSELLARLPASSSVLCVEAHQPLMALAMREGLPRDPRLFIVRTDEADTAARMLREIGVGKFRRVVEVPLSAGYRLAPAVYAGMRRALEDQVREHWRNRLTLIALGSLQVRNLFANLPLLASGGDLASMAAARPVIVAGAGPSLEDVLPVLRAERGRVTLLAVDTALPRLAAESLEPDVVVALEAQIANLRDFLPPPAGGSVLACELSACPVVPRLFGDRVRFFSSAFAPLHLFGRMASAGMLPCPLPALGSVGVAAVLAALRLARGDVFLAGLDFSYPKHLTHARGTPHHVTALSRSCRVESPDGVFFRAIADRRTRVVPDKSGRQVATDPVLASYRDSLRRIIAGEAGRVFDAGSTGLDLGAARVTSRELREKLRSAPAHSAPLDSGRPPFSSAQNVQAFVRSELDILLRGSELLRAGIASHAAAAECMQFLGEADYAWVHFPDEPGDGIPDRSFLARALVAVSYYAQRLQRLESFF